MSELLPLEGYPSLLPLTVEELEALARLGPDAFERWAVRGFIASS